LQFAPHYHGENPHEVYLSMFLHSGWIGGFAFILLCLATLFFGFRHTLRQTNVQASLIVFTGCWCGLIFESFIIDSEHWRHLFVVLAVIWGIVASPLYQRRATLAPAPTAPPPGKPRRRASLAELSLWGSELGSRSAAVASNALSDTVVTYPKRVRASLRDRNRNAA
jgi:hypothetical protein